jgi:hypothetical protein
MRVKGILLAFAVLLVPAAVFAQASLTGVVRDTSGGVLPGVTVEAASPVLIEKARSTVTDNNGRYQIIDLRPGTYRVTFTLSGFAVAVREGMQLSGTATFNADAELRVSAVQETITVSGEAPTVNLQTTTRQAVMDQEIVAAIPTARNPFSVGVLIPGVRKGAFTGQDVGGSVVQEVASLEANGSRTNDQRMMVNGVALSSMIAGGWGGGAVPNATGTAEFAIDVSGVDAQAATGGVRINFIPRDGGNTFSGALAGAFAAESFGGDNLKGSDLLQEFPGLILGKIKGNADFNPGFGGPLKRDKVWFFLSARMLYADNYVANMEFNANANRLDRFDYVKSGRQAVLHQEQKIGQARVTWQINQRNKLGVTADFESFCACTTGITAGGPTPTTPEAGVDRRFPLQRFVTTDWSSPVSNKVLLEASAIHRVERWGGMHPQEGKLGNIDALTPGIVSITDNPNPVTGGSLTYRSAAQFNNSWNWNLHYRAAVSYITGSHSFKVGFNNARGYHDNTTYTSPAAPYSYSFASGAPTAITYRITPRTVRVNVDRDLGFFAQDKWTTGRWTLAGGIRYDNFKNSFPETAISGVFFGRTLNNVFPDTDNLNWHDITPKLGATWDVFGTGRTAVKVTLNKYLEGMGTTGFGPAQVTDAPHPILRISGINQNSTRTWGDANGNRIPDCDLNNFDVNGECGALGSAATWGTLVGGTEFDPDVLTGWGKRFNNWEFTTSVQQEIIPRLSAELQYARRWYGNQRVTDDLAVSAADYQRFTFTTPADSRLPGGGGQTMTGFDLTTAGNARPAQYFVTLAKNYGEMTERFDGFNLSVNSRLRNGLIIQGGLGTGRQVTNDCGIVDDLPEMLHTFIGNPNRFFGFAARPLERCEENNGWRTQVQGLAAYTIPKVDVSVSATFQNLPGAQLAANFNLPAGSTNLGRAFTAAPFRAINIVPAGTVFVERLNQIDFRVAKIFRFESTRTNINFDFYNITNSNSVIGENASYTPLNATGIPPNWRTPQTLLVPRMFKISAQFDF